MIDIIIKNPYLVVQFFIAVFLITSSLIVFFRTRKFYILSEYKGLKIFSFSFLYFAIAFFFSYFPYFLDIFFIRDFVTASFLENYYFVVQIVFYYMITLATFSLIYSLIWKEFENFKLFNKLLNKVKFFKNNKEITLYLDSLIITVLAFYKEIFWFIIILIVLAYACFLSYSNYKNQKLKGKKNNFTQFYFYATALAFIGFASNFLIGFFSLINIYSDIIIVFIFAIFLWGSYKIN